MNLKYRFTLLFSLFVFIILLVAAASIYLLCEDFRKDDFLLRVRTNALSRYHLFYNSRNDKDGDVISQHRETFSLYDEKTFICDSAGKVLYSYPGGLKLANPKKLIGDLKENEEASFKRSKQDGLVLSSNDYGVHNYIIASAYDHFGHRKMQNLKYALIVTLLGGLALSTLLAFLFFRQFMKPLAEFSYQIKSITENKLDARVDISKSKDELSELGRNFNSMLDRLQNAFEMQKNFVQYASHELRTPIANMLTQTEAALNRELEPAELKKVLASLREEQVALSQIINSLLLLSQFETSSSLNQFFPVRIDEVIYETIEEFKQRQPEAIIHLNFLSVPENSNYLTIKGNEALLKTAVHNLISNAYQYSTDASVSISINADEKEFVSVFENKGRQLTDEERKRLFIPFFRGENAGALKGTGLGLSIVQRIVTLHRGAIEYKAGDASVNQFILKFTT